MKLLQLLAFVLSAPFLSFGQFAIGHTTKTFNDPARTGGFGSGGGPGRQIQTEIYYPATSAGNDTPLQNGTFPMIVIGHGFVMSWDAYQNLIDHYVPLGYVLAFPRTEGGISPNHGEFGLDLIQVAASMQAQNALSTSVLYQFWNGKKAVMGHSMGGGASFLAAGNAASSFDLLVGLAPAETTPSAITAAASVSIPAVVFSGSEDGVTPPVDHHSPMYAALTSSCKQFISITGGGHCYFANSSTTCDFGETTSGGNISITRAQQHATTFLHLDRVLAFYLQGDCTKWNPYITGLSADANITFLNSCTYTTPVAPVISLNGSMLSIPSTSLTISWSLNGTVIPNATTTSVDTTGKGAGLYTVTLTDPVGCSVTAQLQVGTLDYSTYLENSLTIYPNPTTNEVVLTWEGEEVNTFLLLDQTGKTIQKLIGTTGLKVELSNFKSGIYFLSTESGLTRKIIKL